ncbi:type I-E CRISPR-associated protein Cas6/Cse3/CasE [Streptomyces hydrogenans]|uniref:type I-E CRISPR-associated protein Cas6/Cse3/CasE n=1 Tax=Streptomyces hydrogenans TaxID=1873719 RepID=UPI0036781DF3
MNTPAPTLTLLTLNPRHKRARADLTDVNALHKTLMKLVPNDLGPSPRAASGLLFRIENGTTPAILTQTHHQPDPTRLPRNYATHQTRSLTPTLKALRSGLTVHYRITAAPVVSLTAHATPHPVTGRTRGKLTSLTGEPAISWWQRRAAAAGLFPLTIDATPMRSHFRRSDTPGPYASLTRFDGVARITDPTALATALTHGIGRAKPYGAGLLSLTPA